MKTETMIIASRHYVAKIYGKWSWIPYWKIVDDVAVRRYDDFGQRVYEKIFQSLKRLNKLHNNKSKRN